jgi:hypothetical protein
MGAYAWYLAAAFLTGYLMFGVVLFARDAKKAPEVPPAEERPYIPVHVHLCIVTPDRPELMRNVWAGKSVDRILWELSEGVTHG